MGSRDPTQGFHDRGQSFRSFAGAALARVPTKVNQSVPEGGRDSSVGPFAWTEVLFTSRNSIRMW